MVMVDQREGKRNVARADVDPYAEKRRIVELTFEPGASVALVARANGVNANQVFKWRRAFERGELVEPAARHRQLCFRLRCRLPSETCEARAGTSRRHGRDPHRVSGAGVISVEAEPMRCCCARFWRACASDRASARERGSGSLPVSPTFVAVSMV